MISEANGLIPDGMYWFAVRESFTDTQRSLKILSRRMHTRQEAQSWADHIGSLVKRKNSDHKYTAILMES